MKETKQFLNKSEDEYKETNGSTTDCNDEDKADCTSKI